MFTQQSATKLVTNLKNASDQALDTGNSTGEFIKIYYKYKVSYHL